MHDDIFTVHKAAGYCQVTPKTIINWIDAGHIRYYRTVGGHRRMKRSDLEFFMKQQGIPIPEPEVEEKGRKRILVVDDDPIIVTTLVMGLKEDEHQYEIESASDGFEAGLKLAAFKPHLVILDIMMPGIKGYEVCEKIKSNPETAGTKVIALSAYLDEEKLMKMKQNGADLCFSKPLPLPDLKEKVAQLLSL